MTEGFQYSSFEEVQHVWRELCWKICFVIQCWKNQWIRLWMWKRLWIKHKNRLKVDLCPPNLQMFWAQPRSTSKYIFTITNNFAVKIIAINYGIMALCFFRPPTVSFRSDQQFPRWWGRSTACWWRSSRGRCPWVCTRWVFRPVPRRASPPWSTSPSWIAPMLGWGWLGMVGMVGISGGSPRGVAG